MTRGDQTSRWENLKSLLEEIYCQSKHIDKNPRPSLPLEPPKMRVKSGDLGLARQNIENPVRRGKIHCGKISQTKILV
jgi:hypothetical protein